MMKLLEAPIKWLEKFGAATVWIPLFLGFFLMYYVFTTFNFETNTVTNILLTTAPIWLLYATFTLFFQDWMGYVRKENFVKSERITLEVKLPQEIAKSPEAMEQVLVQLHQKAAIDNHFQTYIDGKHPPVFSLEIVSREGNVKFYINLPKRYKNQAEAHLYAQYAGVEIFELPIDYTAEIPYDPEKYVYFSFHFGKKKDQALPIKTYIESGLHTMPKEEEKTDPITTVLDALGSVGPNEFYWVQILIDANIERTFKEGSLTFTPDWTVGANAFKEKLIEDAGLRSGGEGQAIQQLTDDEKDTVKAIERGMSKAGFNTAIRAMYFAKKEHFNPAVQIPALTTMWRAWDDNRRNGIGVRWRTDVDWSWQDRKGEKVQEWKRQELDQYKRRVYIPRVKGGIDGKKVFTTEELATIFHLPGAVALTPTLERIPSTRSEAPANLPTG